MPSADTPDDSVLAEGAYYLSELGLTEAQIAQHFETKETKVRRLLKRYAAGLADGSIVADPFDRVFWEDVKKEAEGDVKLTIVSEKGFHHTWKSELAKLDGPSLLAIFEASSDFLNSDPNRRFLDYAAPKGYDPLALEREVRKAVEAVKALLDLRWKEQRARGDPEGKS